MKGMRFRTQNGRKNQGFTLIELAIALVIIGILVGAILKGSDLIDSARAKSITQSIKEIETAVWTFYDKARRFPGDCDRNGLIDYTLTSTQPALSNSTTPPTGYCTGTGDQDSPFNDLKYAEIFSSGDPNSELARHIFDGYIVLGSNGTVNAMAIYNMPTWAAREVDASIDRGENGLTGRIRRFDTAADWPTDKNTRVVMIYFFGKTP
jgi:prepilin-type N-terminal cleavage/methylation domain-containing protein